MQHSYSIQTSASAEKVWDLSTDVRNWKSWSPDLREVEFQGKFDENAKGYLVPEKGMKTPFRIASCKPNFTFTVLTRFPLAQMYLRRMIGYHNHKTIVTQEIWMEGPLSRLWWQLVGRRYQQSMPGVMEHMREESEH